MSKYTSADQTVRFLSSAFAKRARNLGSDNRKGTELYEAQVHFCYLIDQIQRGADSARINSIAEANKLIDNMGPAVDEQVVNIIHENTTNTGPN